MFWGTRVMRATDGLTGRIKEEIRFANHLSFMDDFYYSRLAMSDFRKSIYRLLFNMFEER